MDNFDINRLTNFDTQYWRIDWFGYLSYSDSSGEHRSSPLVDVYLSPLKYTPKKVRTYNTKKISNYEKPIKVSVPVEYLTVLHIGDIWHQGQLYLTPDYEDLQTHDIDVTSQNTETLLASTKQPNGKYLVPYTHHPYHAPAPNAFCEVFTYQNTKIIIPHWAIIQAYFSKCSYLFRQAFKVGLELDSIYSTQNSYMDNGHGRLEIKKKVHDVAVEDVARIAWDKEANRAYSMISSNLAKNSNNGWPITPKTQFPFSGKTSLTLTGKYLANDEESSSRPFFVFKIQACTAEYPCSSLSFYRDNPGKMEGPSNTLATPVDSTKKPRHVPKNNGKIELTPHQEPDSALENLIISTQERTKLIGATKIKTEKRYKNLSSGGSYRSHVIQQEVSTSNSGDGKYLGNGAPANFTQQPKRQKEKKKVKPYIYPEKICRLQIFRRVCEKIAKFSSVKDVSFIPVNAHLTSDHQDFSYFPKTFTPSGQERSWRYLDYIKGHDSNKNIQRRALVARIILDEVTCYVIEVERRITKHTENYGWKELDNIAMLTLHSTSDTTLKDHELERLLLTCAENSGTWRHKNDTSIVSGFKLNTKNHPGNESVLTHDVHDLQIISKLQTTLGVKFEQDK